MFVCARQKRPSPSPLRSRSPDGQRGEGRSRAGGCSSAPFGPLRGARQCNGSWTGQYELLERVRARLMFVLPLTLGLVFVILYLNFRGVAQTLIVMLGLPFAA